MFVYMMCLEKKKIHLYIYKWITLLYTWNSCQLTVFQHKIKSFKKKKQFLYSVSHANNVNLVLTLPIVIVMNQVSLNTIPGEVV